ncbi:MAG: methyltransferase domain-containing protein [Clostridia bacterium]|nr:methyltransferase domain-containing protein [Clostridia bacterium]
MAEWNSELYLKFKNQRTQPSIDLVKRICIQHPHSILDIGCGPGNSTKVLKDFFPDAEVLGIDNSENMIAKAKETYPDITFQISDITDHSQNLGKFDIIFSNACLQWVPDHKTLLPALFEKLNENGVLAVQIPMNEKEMLFQIVNDVVCEEKWKFASVPIEEMKTLTCEDYFDILSSLTSQFDVWETVYYHNMPSIDSMIDWIKGSRLRPYLHALNEADQQLFLSEIAEKASHAYKKQENGEIIFKFRRFFFTAVRSAPHSSI